MDITKLELAKEKLAQATKEMGMKQYYYVMKTHDNMTHLSASQQKEWISRLSMIVNELEEINEENT